MYTKKLKNNPKKKAKTDNDIGSILEKMVRERNFRVALARASHYWFFHFYFPHYVTFPTADFHRDIFELTEARGKGITVIVAFRESGKSTVCTVSYPLWAILGKEQKKFVVILSQTQRQARLHLSNLKKELEQNPLLRSDLGPFKEEADEWGGYSLVIPRYNARITAASSEQSIRGLRHLQYRPDVIIADDVEDLQSVRTQEGRDRTYGWFKGDVMPSGTIDTKVIVVGSLLHEDSLLRRLENEIQSGALRGESREYPIIGDDGKTLWPGKFSTPDMLENEKRKIGDERAWQREYLLMIVPAEDQVVHREWIHYYDEPPSFSFDKYSWTKIAIDLAISGKQTADYTAMVTGSLFGRYGNTKLYIHAFPVNERLTFPATIEKAKMLAVTANPKRRSELLVEEVAYQASGTQQLTNDWYSATGIKVGGMDKRARLSLVSQFIKNGNVIFPKKGCELLINQIVNFGVDKHDDLMDAFVLLVMYVIDDMRHGSMPVEKIDKL